MPLARALSRTLAATLCLALMSCATMLTPSQSVAQEVLTPDSASEPQLQILPDPEGEQLPATQSSVGPTARIPNQFRSTFAEMMIQRVEENVSREEVARAIQGMLTQNPVCLGFPALWLESASRRGVVVRYDLMARDWGEDSAASARQRMEEFVELGYMSKRDIPELGVGVVEYTLTDLGRTHMRGQIEPGQRPTFCAPAERRLVEITSMEFGRYPCGSLHVRFTHVADAWPAWAQTEDVRARLAQNWPPIGEAASGEVSLSRLWYRARNLPEGVENGRLQSMCYDNDRNRIVGDDLNLAAAP